PLTKRWLFYVRQVCYNKEKRKGRKTIMHRWYSIFPKNPWLSIYVWIVFCLLPFFFIFRSSSPLEILIGITLLILFFLSYMFSFKSKSVSFYFFLNFVLIFNI